jgi:hypothetical protein
MSNVAAQTLDLQKLAQDCRKRIRERYPRETSCIESAFLFERAAGLLGQSVQRVVCQATAMTPLLAQAVADGKNSGELLDLPGYWAVAVGMLQSPEDYVGRAQPEINRYVGHVVCLTDTHLIDVSVDQMNRPAKQLVLDEPLVVPYEGQRIVVGFNRHNSIVKYTLHPDVPVPMPRTDKILERMAKAVAQDWRK